MEQIELVAHQPMWKLRYEAERALLQQGAGPFIAALHHVGSTAVTDLLAKPIIDIALEARVYPPPPAVIEKLAALGYVSRGEGGVRGRHWFSKGNPRQFHLHWCREGSVIIQKQIAFREALRARPELRRAYEKVKLEALPGQSLDSTAYAEAKTDLIAATLDPDHQAP